MPAYGRFDWNYCPICSGVLSLTDDGQGDRPYCAPCDRFYYSNPTPAACCFLTNERGELLLVQRAIEPRKGLWTLPGGFVELGESTEEGALRELREETGLTGTGTRLLGVTTRSTAKHGGIIVIGYTVDRWVGKMSAMTDAMDLGFYPPDKRPPIAFEVHQELIALYDHLRDSGEG